MRMGDPLSRDLGSGPRQRSGSGPGTTGGPDETEVSCFTSLHDLKIRHITSLEKLIGSRKHLQREGFATALGIVDPNSGRQPEGLRLDGYALP